jgi:hypothetical protein
MAKIYNYETRAHACGDSEQATRYKKMRNALEEESLLLDLSDDSVNYWPLCKCLYSTY